MRVKNFLKPDRHNHKDPQVRLTWVEATDPELPENQQLLEPMALSDEDLSVRLAAIRKLYSAQLLHQILSSVSEESEQIQIGAEKRLAEMLVDSRVSDNDVGLFLKAETPQYAKLFLLYSSNEAQRQRAIDLISDESMLLEVVQQSRLHDARLAAATRLTKHDNMRAALSACRSRDKVVAKILQQRLDEKAAAEADKIAAVHAVNTTLSSIQSLASSVWSPQHSGKLTAYQDKWASFDATLTKESDEAFKAAAEQVQALIDEHIASEQAAAAPVVEAEPQAEVTQTGDADVVSDPSTTAETSASSVVANIVDDEQLNTLLETIRPMDIAALNVFLATKPADAGSNGQNVLAHGAAVGVLFDPPFDLNKSRPGAIEQRIKRVETLVNIEKMLPGIALEECVYFTELQAHLVALRSRLEKAKQESSDRIKATHRQFAALAGTVAEGKWGPASSMLRRLQKKIAAMEPAERNSLGDKLARAEKQLAEMADWQDFAARPKLEALCEQMEALLEDKEPQPEKLSKEVKALQAQWKALGVSRASNELWTRFKTAGDAAYEPCKAFFEIKQKERQTKLDAKAVLCDQLEALYKETDWEAPDWKKLVRAVSNAKRDWSQNRVVDRKPDKDLEQRFSDALKPIESKLDEQYDAHAAEKRELIEKVQKLAESEINQHTVNQVKSYQSAWKIVGIMRRKEDQTLWEEFNGHCRTIFQHQHQVEREKYQESMSHVFRARDIIKELKQISRGNSHEEQQISALQAEFQGLAEFPDKDKKFLLRDFRGAMDACSKLQENASKRREKAEQEEVLRKVSLCEQLEDAVEQQSGGPIDALLEDIEHSWEATEASVSRESASKLLKRRNAAIKHLKAGTLYNYDKAEEQRRELLIRMEIVAGIETPSEDKSRRMVYQLAHLSEGMTSSGIVDKRDALAALELQWHAAAPVRGSIRDSLQSRYLSAVKK